MWYPFANIFNALPSAREHRRDVEMLREGGSNHFVSFTFIEKDALYDAADREGLLVFQELPYHQLGPMKVLDPAYPRHREYVEWSLREVENIVRQLRGHACVVVWAAFAETRKNEQWVWGDYTDYNEAIRAIVERADPDAIYHPSFCDFNEEHIWNGGFPFGEFWDHYDRNYHFISEFGAIAPPVVETLREIFPPEAIWDRADKADGRCNLPIDVEEYSYRWAFDYAGLTTSVARMYRFADRRPPSLERFVDAIQWYQALGLRYCAETYRRKRFADIGGCRTWSYRENVPGIKFTVVDHRQRPKLGYFGLQQGYAPLLLSLDEQYPLEPRAAGSTYVRDLWLINDRPRAETLSLEAVLYRVSGEELWRAERELGVGPDSSSIEPLAVELPSRGGPCLLRTTARRPDGSLAARADNWLRVVEPVYATPLRVLLLGQSRYNQPICDALAPVAGIELTVVDERSRDPQQSGWCEALGERYDVLWFAGWDYAAHQFRESEWERIEAAVRGGLGFVHTGGQASFHGGDGRGALLDATPLGAVLPVSLRPHDGVWDREPSVDPGQAQAALGIELAGLPFHGFSRTQALPGAEVHATIDGFPLLVTGRHGAGATAILTASFTKPLRMFRVERASTGRIRSTSRPLGATRHPPVRSLLGGDPPDRAWAARQRKRPCASPLTRRACGGVSAAALRRARRACPHAARAATRGRRVRRRGGGDARGRRGAKRRRGARAPRARERAQPLEPRSPLPRRLLRPASRRGGEAPLRGGKRRRSRDARGLALSAERSPPCSRSGRRRDLALGARLLRPGARPSRGGHGRSRRRRLGGRGERAGLPDRGRPAGAGRARLLGGVHARARPRPRRLRLHDRPGRALRPGLSRPTDASGPTPREHRRRRSGRPITSPSTRAATSMSPTAAAGANTTAASTASARAGRGRSGARSSRRSPTASASVPARSIFLYVAMSLAPGRISRVEIRADGSAGPGRGRRDREEDLLPTGSPSTSRCSSSPTARRALVHSRGVLARRP